MLLKICSVARKRFVIVIRTLDDFTKKVKQMLDIEGQFRCVLEDDGSAILDDVLEAIFEDNDKVGVIMILKEGEHLSPVGGCSLGATGASAAPSSGGNDPPLPPVRETGGALKQNASTSSTKSDVRAVLARNPKGQTVLAEYDKYGTLCSESRQTLIKVVVAQLVAECGPYPSKEANEQLASSIVTSLPGLKASAGLTGYEHFFSVSNGQTGYIQERLKRLRRSLAPDAHQRPRNTQPKRHLSTPVDEVNCNLPVGEQTSAAVDLTEADVAKLRQDCCYCSNPVTDRVVILSGMSKTANARQQWIRASRPSITEVLEQYPRLEDMPFELQHREAY